MTNAFPVKTLNILHFWAGDRTDTLV